MANSNVVNFIAAFAYRTSEPGDLSFEKGDYIKLENRIDDSWAEGSKAGKRGIFPLALTTPSDPKVQIKSDLRVRAKQAYMPKQSDHLSFVTGDEIAVLYRGGELLEGRLKQKSGMFPLTLVEPILPPRPARFLTTDPYAIAIADFQGLESDELTFHAWDRIQLRRRIDANWLEGVHAGSAGIFPVKFVRVVVDLPSAKNTAATIPDDAARARVLFRYDAIEAQDLPLIPDDIVGLMKRLDADWYQGFSYLDPQRKGIFPVSHVEVIRHLDNDKYATKQQLASSQSATPVAASPASALSSANNTASTASPVVTGARSGTNLGTRTSSLSQKQRLEPRRPVPPQPSALNPLSSSSSTSTPVAAPSHFSTISQGSDTSDSFAGGGVELRRHTDRQVGTVRPPSSGKVPPPRPLKRATVLVNDTVEGLSAAIETASAAYDALLERKFACDAQLMAADTEENRAEVEKCKSEERQLVDELENLKSRRDRLLDSGDEDNDTTTSGGARKDIEREIAELEDRINAIRVELECEAFRQNESEDDARTRKQNRGDLEQFLSQLKADRDSLCSKIGRVQPQVTTDPSPAAERKSDHRFMVVRELVTTEQEFNDDLNLCKTGYLCSTGLPSDPDIDLEKLFCNFEEVIAASTQLLERLKPIISLPAEQQNVGSIFLELAEPLRKAYVKYCCNFDTATATLAEYATSKKGLLDSCQFSINSRTNCWDLGSFLIKPVQRILKYPLLLNELLKKTPEDHNDRPKIVQAGSEMARVATSINEGKRGKEIVAKYKEKKRTLNLSMKKVIRIKQAAISRVQGRDEDKEFEPLHQRLDNIAYSLHKTVKRSREYLTAVEEACNLNTVLLSHIKDMADVVAVDQLLKLQSRMQDCVRTQATGVTRLVIEPLEKVMKLARDSPEYLVQKREDKHLDWQAALRKAKGDPDKMRVMKRELDEAESTFRALNAQLIEDLPIFCSTAERILERCLQKFMCLQLHYFKSQEGLLQNLRDMALSLPNPSLRLNEAVNQLVVVGKGIYTDTIKTELSDRSLGAIRFKPAKRAQSALEISNLNASHSESSFANESSTDVNVDEDIFGHAPSVSSQYPMRIVTARFDFQALHDHEIPLTDGIQYELLQDTDMDGNREWWRVRSAEGREGFAPSNYFDEEEHSDTFDFNMSRNSNSNTGAAHSLTSQRNSRSSLPSSRSETPLRGTLGSSMSGTSLSGGGSTVSTPTLPGPSSAGGASVNYFPTKANSTTPSVSSLPRPASVTAIPGVAVQATTSASAAPPPYTATATTTTTAVDSGSGVDKPKKPLLAKVLFSFTAQSAAELNIQEDEVVVVIAMADPEGNSEWWKVRKGQSTGYVPSNYLEVLTNTEFV